MRDDRPEKEGGLVVCQDGRLQPTGELKECFKGKEHAGYTIGVKLYRRSATLPLWPEVIPGYWAEIVILPPVTPYTGPPTVCRLPEQFERFERPQEPNEMEGTQPQRDQTGDG